MSPSGTWGAPWSRLYTRPSVGSATCRQPSARYEYGRPLLTEAGDVFRGIRRHAWRLPGDFRDVLVRRARRHACRLHRDLRAGLRPGPSDLPLLDGAHPAREDRRAPPPSAGGRDQDPLPALAGLWRPALAARLALGLLEAGLPQDGLRHRPQPAGARLPAAATAAARTGSRGDSTGTGRTLTWKFCSSRSTPASSG